MNVTKSELTIFKESIRLLQDQGLQVPFEVIDISPLSDTNGSKQRTFQIFTPKQFLAYSKENKINFKTTFNPADDSIIIGLFAGEKGSSGYTIQTMDISLLNNQVNVRFRETEPEADQIYLTYISYPCQFISVNLSSITANSVQFTTHNGQALANVPLPKY